MRIGIDGTGIQVFEDGSTSGIVTYSVQIISHLLEIDKKNSYYIYCFKDIPSRMCKKASNALYRKFKTRNRKSWQQLVLPIVSNFDSLDLMFFPGNAASFIAPCKTVATIHDLHPIVVRDSFNKVHSEEIHGDVLRSIINKIYWRLMMRIISKKDRVIAVSSATKKDVQKYYKVPSERVYVVHEGVDLKKFNLGEDVGELKWFRQKYDLPNCYILCVGTHGYKNLEGSIRAFKIVKEKKRSSIKLVIAGSKRSISSNIDNLIEQMNLRDDVIFTGFFPDDEMKYLYYASELLLFPSFYEGFGLPLLEAFICRTVVITSKAGALTEVGGDAVLFVDPYDPENIASAICKVLNNNDLKDLKREAGLKQIENFSWQKAAEKTLKIFENAIASDH